MLQAPLKKPQRLWKTCEPLLYLGNVRLSRVLDVICGVNDMRQSRFLKPSERADSTVAQPLTVRIDKRVNLTSQDGNERSCCEISR